MNKASKSEGTPFAGLVRWLGGLAAHVSFTYGRVLGFRGVRSGIPLTQREMIGSNARFALREYPKARKSFRPLHFLNQSGCYLANAFQPVRLPLFLPISRAAAPKLTGVAVCSITAPPSFPFCKINNSHGLTLPFVRFIVADEERNGGDLACVQKDFAGAQK